MNTEVEILKLKRKLCCIKNESIGSLVAASESPGNNYLEANGQIVNQSDYPGLFEQIGIQPAFNVESNTVLAALKNIAYSPLLDLYVGFINSSTIPNIYTSIDGINWNASDNSNLITGTPSDIAWCEGAGIFILCVSLSSVFISRDGYNWTMSHAFSPATKTVVTCSNNTIVIAGGADLLDATNRIVHTSTDGITWTNRNFNTTSVTITCLHYSTGLSLYIAGGSAGQIYTSPDAITWTVRTSNIASQINSIDSHSSLIVVVGNSGVISTSPDGITWTSRTGQTASSINGVAYLSTAIYPWVAIGATTVQVSTDGLVWNTLFGSTTGTRKNIFYGNGKYVMIGSNRMVSYSTDLLSWRATVAATGGADSNTMNSGAYGAGVYVIVGAGGKIDSSSDAINWTNRTANAGSNQLTDVIFVGGSINLFIAVGVGNTIVTSPDGITWTARTSNVVSTLNAIAVNSTNDVIVAVGTSGKITRSTDGINWASQTSNITQPCIGVAWNGTIFCAVTTSEQIATSSDGSTWTGGRPTGVPQMGGFQCVTSDGTYFYTVVFARCIYRSTNGFSWTAFSSFPTPLTINWVNNQLLGHNASKVYSSLDGKSWIFESKPVSGSTFIKNIGGRFLYGDLGNVGISIDDVIFTSIPSTPNLSCIAYSESQDLLVATNTSSNVIYSSDGGNTWNPSQFIENSTCTGIAYSPSLDLFVIVANNGCIATSSNGAVWTQRAYTNLNLGTTIIGGFNGIIWSEAQSLFVAAGLIGTIATSPDGIIWTTQTSGVTSTLNAVTYNSILDLFIVGGNAGVILTSTDGINWTSIPIGHLNNYTAISTFENKGIVAGDNVGGLWLSEDGTTWNSYSQGTTGGYSKLIYSEVDDAIFGVQLSNIFNSTVIWTKDGRNVQGMIINSSTRDIKDIVYNSISDKYIAVGSTGYIYTLTRSYNKTTQFVLPSLINTWIKVK